MKTLKLDYLENALKYWEQTNIFGEFMFVSKNNGLFDSGNGFRPLPGSEISANGVLGRKIPNFELLRSELKKGIVDPLPYLPRVPTKDREKGVTIEQLLDDSTGNMLMLPVQLSQWLSTKKVCRITQEADIPQVSNQNYLHLLPYDNFLLSLDDPFVYNKADINGIGAGHNYSTFLISRKDWEVTVYAISNEIERSLLTSLEKKIMLEAILAANKKRKSAYMDLFMKLDRVFQLPDSPFFSFIKFEINIHEPVFKKTIKNKLGDAILWAGKKVFGKRFNNLIEQNSDLKELREFEGSLHSIFPKFLNGFCKYLAEAETNTMGVKMLIAEPNRSNVRKSSMGIINDLDWNEVPLGTVIDLHIDRNSKGEVISKRSAGSEKSYHIRAGHYRKYPQTDGTIKSVWVRSSKVRPDKSPEHGGQTMSGVKTVKRS